MRRPQIAILSLLFLTFSLVVRQAAADEVPTVTVMQSGSNELKSDLEFLMKLGGKDGEQQWPIVDGVLDAFLQGVDGARPIRVDLILGEEPDTRLSIPMTNEKAFLGNVGAFIGAKARRMGQGLYQFRAAGMQYFSRSLPARNPDWGVVVEDRTNAPANFQILGAIQPLIGAGFDLAARVENSSDGVDDRRQVVLDLEKEVTATLQPFDAETDSEFEMRKLGLTHQFRELERLYADSQQLTLGWTTDQEKQEGRLDLELTALEDTDLAASIEQLAAEPSLFSSAAKSDNSIFFGAVNHALDEMRQKHFGEMLDLMEKDAGEKIEASEDLSDDQKAGAKVAAQKLFEMLRAGTAMGVFDGFVDVSLADGKKSVVGALRVADGSVAVEVLQGLKDAGWEVEIGSAGEEAKDEGEADESESSKEDEESDAEAEAGDDSDAVGTEADTTAVTYHKVTLPEGFTSTVTSLFGNATFHVATSRDAVYYAAGEGAEDRVKAAVAGTGADPDKNDGTFLETWFRVGPILDVLRERRERKEVDLDPTKLTAEEKSQRKERQERRERAQQAFEGGADTIHSKLQRKDSKVVGQTVFATDILRFVGLEITNVAKTKLQ
ncbi:MAG: hypothetical protein ACYTGL_01620 [Planctomycetota bacterium]